MLLLLAVASTLNPATAANHRMLRCKGGVVMAGIDKYQLLKKCGLPLNWEESSRGVARHKTERFLYRPGNGSPTKAITVRDGKVTDIESLE